MASKNLKSVNETINGNDDTESSTAQLQPRKRAKTTEEKEQRKMERILRNRRAAHKSRERKRFYLNLFQEKSEKYDLLFEKLLETGILESHDAFKNDAVFTKLKNELMELNKKQSKFERENGTVNSSIPKKSEKDSEEDDYEDEESEIKDQLQNTADALLFLEPESSTKKRKLNSRKDSSVTVVTSSSTTPDFAGVSKYEDSNGQILDDGNSSNALLSPTNSITTIKNNEDVVLSKPNFNNNKINTLDLSLELGIDLEEPAYNMNSNALLCDSEVDDVLIMQRYPAVITFNKTTKRIARKEGKRLLLHSFFLITEPIKSCFICYFYSSDF